MLGTEMLAECLLLEPVSLELSVVRNLSIQWYHKSAGVEIAGNLHHFSVRLPLMHAAVHFIITSLMKPPCN